MLTVGMLKNILENLPDSAIVYVEADHRQLPEQAQFVNVTFDKPKVFGNAKELPYYGEEILWDEVEGRDAEFLRKKTTAILISCG